MSRPSSFTLLTPRDLPLCSSSDNADSSTCTIYDFENLRKGVMTDKFRDVLLKRAHF